MFRFKITKRLFVVFLSYLLLVAVSHAETPYKVKSTDNLSKIVNKFYKNSHLSRHQIYIGILAENPNAFGLGNINYLQEGKLLNLPDSTNLLAMEVIDAKNLVMEHNNNAKQGKRIRIAPPFEGYTPQQAVTSEGKNINTLAEKQQAASEKLEKLDSETESLRIRLEQLAADKEAMDAEIRQLDSLLKQ